MMDDILRDLEGKLKYHDIYETYSQLVGSSKAKALQMISEIELK